jgi:hypothetical protein
VRVRQGVYRERDIRRARRFFQGSGCAGKKIHPHRTALPCMQTKDRSALPHIDLILRKAERSQAAPGFRQGSGLSPSPFPGLSLSPHPDPSGPAVDLRGAPHIHRFDGKRLTLSVFNTILAIKIVKTGKRVRERLHHETSHPGRNAPFLFTRLLTVLSPVSLCGPLQGHYEMDKEVTFG